MWNRRGACKRCGRDGRFRRRTCPACRRSDRAEMAVDAADTAIELGALGWVWRGVRIVVRALTN
ncbi:hypothetical protein HCK01_06315 [Streptomyces sp. AA8]|nr:hypothetical protein [Streptomyces telluris]